MQHQKTRIVALTGGALLLAGCAHPVEFRPRHTGHMVAPANPAIVAFAAGEPGYAAYGRRDASLSYRPATPIVNAGAWPTNTPASLADAKRIRLPSNADQILVIPSDSGRAHRRDFRR